MSNAISRAARERQARTGEPYTLARRMVIEEHAAAKAAEAPEAAAFAESHGEFLRNLLAPTGTEAGPPYTHTVTGEADR